MRDYSYEACTKWGPMTALLCDTHMTPSLVFYGEWAQHEVAICLECIRPGDHVLDIGANIGAFTIPLARAVGRNGFLAAFEPQRIPFYALAGNLVKNHVAEWSNAHNLAIGDEEKTVELPTVDVRRMTNVGGVRMDDADNRAMIKTTLPPSRVRCVRIDGMNLPRLDFMKIDVEGWESKVLRGAADTVSKFRPKIFAESLPHPMDHENRVAMGEFFRAHDYLAWEFITPLYTPDNCRFFRENLFGEQSDFNVLAVHKDQKPPVCVERVELFTP